MLFWSTLCFWLCLSSHWFTTCDTCVGKGVSLGCWMSLGRCREMPWVTFCHCMEVWRQPAGTASASVGPCLPSWCWAVYELSSSVSLFPLMWADWVHCCWGVGWSLMGWPACILLLPLLWVAQFAAVYDCGVRMGWKLTSASWYCYEWVWPAATIEYVSTYWGPTMVLFSWSFIQREQVFLPSFFPSLFLSFPSFFPSSFLLDCFLLLFLPPSIAFVFFYLLSVVGLKCRLAGTQDLWKIKEHPRNSLWCCSSSHEVPSQSTFFFPSLKVFKSMIVLWILSVTFSCFQRGEARKSKSVSSSPGTGSCFRLLGKCF